MHLAAACTESGAFHGSYIYLAGKPLRIGKYRLKEQRDQTSLIINTREVKRDGYGVPVFEKVQESKNKQVEREYKAYLIKTHIPKYMIQSVKTAACEVSEGFQNNDILLRKDTQLYIIYTVHE